MKSSQMKLYLIIATLFLFSGCKSLGSFITEIAKPHPEKALIYIYRPKGFKGAAVNYRVFIGEELIARIINGGYYSILVDPGEKEIWAKTESKSSVNLNAESGKIYYVKALIRMGFFVGRPSLSIVPNEKAEKEVLRVQRDFN